MKTYILGISQGKPYEECDRIELFSHIDGMYRVSRQNTLAQRRNVVYKTHSENIARQYISSLVGYDIDSIPF